MNTYEVHDLRSRETKPVSQSRRERKHRGSKRKKKRRGSEDGWGKKERKREEGAHFLTFFMLHASRDHGSGRERKKERKGRRGEAGQGTTTPPPDEFKHEAAERRAGLPPLPLRSGYRVLYLLHSGNRQAGACRHTAPRCSAPTRTSKRRHRHHREGTASRPRSRRQGSRE
jgi:hypothetical protein